MDRGQVFVLARTAKEAKRFGDAVRIMKEVTRLGIDLKSDERDLLFSSWKLELNTKRAALRVLSMEETVGLRVTTEETKNLVWTYQEKIKKEFFALCDDALATIKQDLMPHAVVPENVVYLWKMEGDFCRYKAEFSDESDDITQASSAYSKASKISNAELKSTNPVGLSLVLSCSILNFHFLGSPDKACSYAKKAYDAAIADIHSLNAQQYQETVEVLNVIRDNLNAWTSQFLNSDSSEEETDSASTSTF
mmetsp:Transcript_39453/g.62382  ORF Transcript_39453/g.62382 Transcript_39453/m.62382 type:complete len:250 (-) Transcript_39453:206-955(-)